MQELRDRLIAHGHQPETHQIEDLVLVRCVFQGRPHTMTELRDALAMEIGERERLFAAADRPISCRLALLLPMKPSKRNR